MTTVKITESSKLGTQREDGAYKVRIINEGVGSSGVYSAKVLEENAHVFDNAPSYMNHVDNASRDVDTLAGKIVGEVFTEQGEDGLGVYGYYKPREKYRDLFDDFRDVIGLSISTDGTAVAGEDGVPVIESLEKTPFTSVDVVTAAGRGGRFEESLKEASGKTPDGSGDNAVLNEGESQMDKAELTTAIQDGINAALEAKLDAIADRVVEKLRPATPEDGVDEAAAVEAAIDAKLPKASRKAVIEAVRSGVSPADAISEQAALVESIRSEVKESYVGRGSAEDASPLIEGWGKH